MACAKAAGGASLTIATAAIDEPPIAPQVGHPAALLGTIAKAADTGACATRAVAIGVAHKSLSQRGEVVASYTQCAL